jgi:hypothetical protein
MTIVLALVAFLSTIFLANATNSLAAVSQKKSPAMTRTSAVDYTETQIKQLQATLNITVPQEPLWHNLTQVMRENAKDMDAINKERAENTKPLNALEHMKLHSRITQYHLDQTNKLIVPFEAFYNSLSDQQKSITDMVFRTGKYSRAKKR